MSNRGYSTAGIAALNGSPEFYQLIELDFDTPLNLTTAPYDIEYDGKTWLSSAIISTIPTLKESLAMRPNNISLQMDGSALVNQLLTFENYNNKEVLIYRYLVDTAETVQEYKGFVQTYKKSENKQSGKSVITWSIASHWFDWSQRYGRVINDQEQQDLHPGDRFFEYFHLTSESITDWAEADADYGGFLGGLITGVAEAVGNAVVNVIETVDDIGDSWGLWGDNDGGHVTTPRQKVDEHVGNAVDPESKIKRVPVMYGEGRVKGIPIFRSLDPANKEFLYVVYLLSEGKVDGLTGNKAEFKNGEPYNSSRLSAYSTLVAEYDGTQTTADSTLTSIFTSTGTGANYQTSAAHSEDDTTINADTGTGTILVGDLVYFGTDDSVLYSVDGALSGGSFTIVGGLKSAIADNTSITIRSLWTSNHIGHGVAYVIMKYKKSNVWQGEPKPAFALKGKHVYDPRDGTTAWSANPALVMYDQLTDTIYGKSIPSAEIDTTSFNAVANLAETTNNDHGGEDGGTPVAVDLFSFDGALLTNTPLRDNLEKVLFNCRGHLTHIAGKYKLIAEQTSETSVYSFTEDNIQGNFEVFETAATAQYNHVLYEIVAPDFDYKPWVEQQKSSTNLAADNNKPSVKVVKNIYERNRYRAKNRAATIMKKSRQGIRVKLTASNADAMSIECGQIVDITRDSEGWSNKLFRVTSMDISKDATCSFSLSEYESSVYDWSVSVEDTPPADTDLPDPTYIKPPTGLLAVSGSANQITTDDGSAENRIKVSWTAPVDEYVEGYQAQYKASSDTVWKDLPTMNDLGDVALFIPNVDENQSYDVRVRSFNAQGTVSAWVALGSAHTVTGTLAVGRLAQIRGADAFENDSVYWHTYFDSIDCMATSAADVSLTAGGGLQLDGGTGNTYCNRIINRPVVDMVWTKARRMRTVMYINGASNIATTPTDTGIGIGNMQNNNSVGFILAWNSGTSSIDVYGRSAITGSSTQTLITSFSGSFAEMTLELIYSPSTNVKFYVDGANETTISTNLPTGTGNQYTPFSIHMDSGSTGASIFCSEYRFLQEQ